MTAPAEPKPDIPPPPTALGAIAGRRTVRRFDPDRPLADEILAALLRLATLAPSPFNLQPWRFVVVRDPRNRRRLRACAFGEARITDAPATLILLGYLEPDRLDLGRAIDRQLGLGAITPDLARRLRAEAPRIWARGDDRAGRAAMLAAATLMIAAEGLGIGSALLDDFDPIQLRQAFGIPDDHAIAGLLALGHPLEGPPFPGRFGLDHVCHAEHFGQPWPEAMKVDGGRRDCDQ